MSCDTPYQEFLIFCPQPTRQWFPNKTVDVDSMSVKTILTQEMTAMERSNASTYRELNGWNQTTQQTKEWKDKRFVRLENHISIHW